MHEEIMQPSLRSHSHEKCVQRCAQLEFIQILVIVVFMMVMVVVITCLLNHYRLSARSLLSRHSPTRRRHLPLASMMGVTCRSLLQEGLWSADGSGSSGGLNEQQVFNPPPADRGVMSYLQREPQRFQLPYGPSRFQPTYPYLPQSLIDLPPTISLSDGEEPPPYQGVCALQLRDPEQQMELNRESVRPPPNRTVFDSHALDPSNAHLQTRLQAPPPSAYSGISVLEAQEALTRQQKQNPGVEGTPPTYSEAIGHFFHPATLNSSQSRGAMSPLQGAPSSIIHGLLRPQGRVENRNSKEKSHKPQQV
ncbi:PREDICTED: protein TMEPAI-like isoform X3 [Cyprinodon variegatus]|uniref:protein TMEPAI-like isoform X3 n=1 Tax=Cyprinodon variegatus TaxID=28743 RepID=UPI000742A04D|nr:PREDICTED: protein TMEPAI-like isoform X3 [Cyprinodon variegatus]